MTITAGDYVSQNQHEIFAGDINNRIDELKNAQDHVDFDRNEEFSDDDLAELAALIDFRDRVQAQTGNHFDEATIVPEDEFQEHARDWAHGIGDFEFLDTYVDWEKFGEDLKSERYTEMDFGDDIVYVR